MMSITGLGHTGFWVDDLAVMRDFYTRVMGLTVTDEDEELGIVFLSAQPEEEHHEFVLQRGRTAPAGSKLTHQVSWRVDSLDSVIDFHRRFMAEGVEVHRRSPTGTRSAFTSSTRRATATRFTFVWTKTYASRSARR